MSKVEQTVKELVDAVKTSLDKVEPKTSLKIYGTPYKGKKSKNVYSYNAIRITKNGKSIQLLSPFKKEIAGKDLLIFGTEDSTIYLNFISLEENNGYDAYAITKSANVSARTFIREAGLKEGVYKVEKVTTNVYKFDKDGVK